MNRIIGIGNALTDLLVNLKSDDILSRFGLRRGSMSLVDSKQLEQLEESVKNFPMAFSPGGSASNTIRALSQMGISCGYIGKIGHDKTGNIFEQALSGCGIETHLLQGESPSGRCMSLISPDGERTMCTFLGAALEMRDEEITPDLFTGYDCLYIEGYLVQDHKLITQAVRTAKSCGLQVALDLASFNVVEENLDFLHNLIAGQVDILFANEQEAAVFTGDSNPLESLDKIGKYCPIVVVKVGRHGAYIKYRGKVEHVGIVASARRVDTTGAGDYYAAGFLAGLCRGLTMEQCGTIGAVVSGHVIEVVGPTIDEHRWADIRKKIEEVTAGTFLL